MSSASSRQFPCRGKALLCLCCGSVAGGDVVDVGDLGFEVVGAGAAGPTGNPGASIQHPGLPTVGATGQVGAPRHPADRRDAAEQPRRAFQNSGSAGTGDRLGRRPGCRCRGRARRERPSLLSARCCRGMCLFPALVAASSETAPLWPAVTDFTVRCSAPPACPWRLDLFWRPTDPYATRIDLVRTCHLLAVLPLVRRGRARSTQLSLLSVCQAPPVQKGHHPCSPSCP